MFLHNRVSKEVLKLKLSKETFKRVTLSFYRYIRISHTTDLRNKLFAEWSALQVFGRIYLAEEGINAQMSVPIFNYDSFLLKLNNVAPLKDIPIKIAVEDDGKSFYKLTIKIRNKIVADGLKDNEFDTTNVGQHLTAAEFNREMNNPDTIVVDMRNHYECEIGHFENAYLPDAATFRDALPEVVEKFKTNKDKKFLLYCTGGIRCEKASAYMRHIGFTDVNQLHGGIIDYHRQIKVQSLPSRFHGKNFVFDERLGERISEDTISVCHQCGEPCDTHTNCLNQACHLLFIQCKKCKEKMGGCCTEDCKEELKLTTSKQDNRKNKRVESVYVSKQKSKLRETFPYYKS